MKKAIAMLLAATLLLSLAACAVTTVPDTDVRSPTDSVASATDTDSTGSVTAATGTDDTAGMDDADAAQTQTLYDTLEAIDANTTVGTAGSSLRAITSAGTLLDWGAATTLSEGDIKSCVTAWLMDKGNDEQVAFAEKMSAVDESMQDLQGEAAGDMLFSAGYESADYPWSDAAYAAADAVMAAVGLR